MRDLDISTSRAEVAPQHLDALRRVRRLLQAHPGFSLLLLEYNDPAYRERLIDQVAPVPPAARYDAGSPASFAGFEAALFELARSHDVIHVIGLDHWLAGDPSRLAGFNIHREHIAANCPASLLLWLPQGFAKAFALHAPDMWEWRAIVLDFSVPRRDEAEHLLASSGFAVEERGDERHTENLERLTQIEVFLRGESVSRVQRASLLEEAGNLRFSSGQLEAALSDLEKAVSLWQELDDARGVLRAQRTIARVKEREGDIAGALALHERRLLAYEELEDRRSRAVTLGDIARIMRNKGQVDQALALHEEMQKVFEELGDRRSRAVTLGDIARILVDKGQVDQALALHEERRNVFEELGDRRERAVTLGDIARIMRNKGQVDQALALHEEMQKVFEELGDRRSRAVTLGDIARIKMSKGQVDQALALHEERRNVFEELGDRASLAHTDWSLARIDWQRGDIRGALERLVSAYQTFVELGHLEGICFVGRDLGRSLLAAGDVESATTVLQRSHAGFVQLGRVQQADEVAALLESNHDGEKSNHDDG